MQRLPPLALICGTTNDKLASGPTVDVAAVSSESAGSAITAVAEPSESSFLSRMTIMDCEYSLRCLYAQIARGLLRTSLRGDYRCVSVSRAEHSPVCVIALKRGLADYSFTT